MPTLDGQAVLLLVVPELVINPVRNLCKCTDIVAIPAYTSPPGLPPLFWPDSASAAKSRAAVLWPPQDQAIVFAASDLLFQSNSLKQSAPHQGVLVAVEVVPLRDGGLDILAVMAASRIT